MEDAAGSAHLAALLGRISSKKAVIGVMGMGYVCVCMHAAIVYVRRLHSRCKQYRYHACEDIGGVSS